MTNDQIIVYQQAVKILCDKEFREWCETLRQDGKLETADDIEKLAVQVARNMLTHVQEVLQ